MSYPVSVSRTSIGPFYLTPRSPSIEAGPIHGAFFDAQNARNVVSEGSGPEGGRITCFGDSSTSGIGSIRVTLSLETGWRLLVTFKADDHDKFRWESKMSGDDDGENGNAQFDTAAGRFYFTTPVVSGTSSSTFSIFATNAPSDWWIEEMQLTATS